MENIKIVRGTMSYDNYGRRPSDDTSYQDPRLDVLAGDMIEANYPKHNRKIERYMKYRHCTLEEAVDAIYKNTNHTK